MVSDVIARGRTSGDLGAGEADGFNINDDRLRPGTAGQQGDRDHARSPAQVHDAVDSGEVQAGRDFAGERLVDFVQHAGETPRSFRILDHCGDVIRRRIANRSRHGSGVSDVESQITKNRERLPRLLGKERPRVS